MKLAIGNKNYSSWSLRAWLCLKQLGVEFEAVLVSLKAGGLQERLGQFSPTNRVPVLIDEHLTVWDSLAICEYVSEQYADGKGWPSEPTLRAQARAIACEMHAGFSGVRSQMPMNCRATRNIDLTANTQKEIARIDSMWSSLCTAHRNRGLWLLGDFSIADCMYAPVVFRFKTYRVTMSPASIDYMNTMLANPHIQQWLADARQETEILPEEEIGVEI